jgi:hypothetical protein
VLKNESKILSACCGNPTPVSLIEINTWPSSPHCDRTMSSRFPSTTFIASMPFIMRFDSLRSPGILPHVLCIICCWFADMAKLKTALRHVKQIPTLLVWGDRDCTISLSSALNLKRKLRASELIVLARGGPLGLQGDSGGVESHHAGMAWPPYVVHSVPARPAPSVEKMEKQLYVSLPLHLASPSRSLGATLPLRE